jgi:hypothetical protein
MRNYSLKLTSLWSLALMVAFVAPQRALADDDDPPGRVARLGYTHGAVSFQPAGTDDWVSAVVNRPITTGDKLWADQDSRAELHIGSASIRISGNTGFSFLNLTDNIAQIQLTAGTLRVRVKRLEENETFEIDTPNLAFSVLRPGTYRVEVNEGGDATIIKVRAGEGEITGGGSAFALRAREVGFFNGTDQLTADIERYQNDDDDFDGWCANRDRHEDISVSARYVSPDVIGYQDLDDYGAWRPVPGYGTVWFPQADTVGWAPYRYGHWAYVSPWGYTWIDDEPWGFAPFHYGRWIHYGGMWGWVPCPPPAPGVTYVRPVYAPALVAWVGGPHFGIAVRGGGGFAVGVNVGWFPLGPREVYVPSYPVSRTYVNNVNVSNTTVNTTVVNNYYNTSIVNRDTTVINNHVNNHVTIHQIYVNQTVAGAVTATTPQAFTSAQSVSKNVVRVDVHEVERAQVNVFTPSVAPAKQAVLGAGAETAAKPPTVLETRAVVAKVAPPPPPVTFAKQQQAIRENGGRPPAISQVRQMQPQTVQAVHPEVKIATPATLGRPEPKGGAGNRAITPTASGPGNSTGHEPENATRPGTPMTAGQPVTGNKPGNVPADSGNANANRKGLEDRPPSATSTASGPGNSTGHAPENANRPGTSVNAGQPVTGNKPGNAPADSGNANANRKGLEDRPPTTRPSSGDSNSGAASRTNNASMPDLNQQRQQQVQTQQQIPNTQQQRQMPNTQQQQIPNTQQQQIPNTQQQRQMPNTTQQQQMPNTQQQRQMPNTTQQQQQQKQKPPDNSSKPGKDDHKH